MYKSREYKIAKSEQHTELYKNIATFLYGQLKEKNTCVNISFASYIM